MCVDDGEGGRKVYREVRVKADRVNIEEWDQRSACMIGELCEKLRTYRSSRNDERVRS